MPEIVITGVRPYDGAYELDFDREFSTREWGWIKRYAGYLPLEVDERTLGDPELACVLAVIAMHRARKLQPGEAQTAFDKLVDAPFGSAITVQGDDVIEAPDPPTPPSSTPNGASSGAGSQTSSGTPASRPSPTGIPGSGTSAFGRATSAS